MGQKWQLGDKALQACISLKSGKEAARPLRPEPQARERSKQDTPLAIVTNQLFLNKQISTSGELCHK